MTDTASRMYCRTLLETSLAALERLEAGEYGYCEDCGEDIPHKRLERAPTATRCVSCASA